MSDKPSLLDRFLLRFELLPNDPFKDREVIKIEVKQMGIAKVIRVNTPNNKTFRKDKYGFFRFTSTPIRGSSRKSAKRKPTTKAKAKPAAKKSARTAKQTATPRTA